MSTIRRTTTIPNDPMGDELLADEQKYKEREKQIITTTNTTVPVKSAIAARDPSQQSHSPSTSPKRREKISWRPHTWTGLVSRILLISLCAFLFHVCYTGWKLTRIIILPNEYLPVWLNVNISANVENEIWSHTILPTQQASVEGDATPESCTIKLGPVIGKTTDTTTRILLEISANMTFRLDLVDIQTGEIHSRTRQVHSHRPAIFAFDNLHPLTRYHIVAHTPCMTGYLYKYRDGSQALGSFRTLPPKGFTLSAPSRFVIISCHDIAAIQNRVYYVDVSDPDKYDDDKYRRNRENDLWWHMARLAQKGSLDYLLHVGDQVYADTEEHIEWESRDHLYPPVHPRPWVNSSYVGQLAYPPTYWSSIEVLKGSDPRDWAANSTTILELYRSVYRVTWGHPPLQYLLSHVPSLMTFDDHEVRDDWGDRPEDSDGHSMEYFVGRMAHRAIIEYQTQLHRDVELWLDAEEARHLHAHHTRKHHTEVDPNPYDEALRGMHHFHVMGQIGVMMVDTRGGRSYYNGHDRNNTGNLYLGEHQWRDIDMALSPHGLFINTTILIVAIPTPIVVLSTRAIDILGWGYDDCWGFWSARPYEADQVRFLQALYEWKHLPVATGQKPRELIIVSGDIHEGGYTDISFRDETFVTQVVSSSIGNTPMPLGGLVTIIVANSISSGVGDTLTAKHDHSNVMRRIMSHHPSDFHYNHLNFIRPRNYAILDIWGERQRSTLSVAAKLSNLTAEAHNIHIYHVMAPQEEGVPPVVVVPKLDFDWER